MEPIFLITGSPAVGKSTTAKALAECFAKSIQISVDSLRDMVVGGFVFPNPEWGPALVEQLELARRTALQMALEYRKADFAVILDDFWDPHSHLAEYDDLRAYPETYRIILYPSQKAVAERNLKRSGKSAASDYIAWGIQLVYEDLQKEAERLCTRGWQLVDNSETSVERTVELILKCTVNAT